MSFGQGWTTGAYFREQEDAWSVFATDFEDGNIHSDHLIWGLDNVSLALIQRSDGLPIVSGRHRRR